MTERPEEQSNLSQASQRDPSDLDSEISDALLFEALWEVKTAAIVSDTEAIHCVALAADRAVLAGLNASLDFLSGLSAQQAGELVFEGQFGRVLNVASHSGMLWAGSLSQVVESFVFNPELSSHRTPLVLGAVYHFPLPTFGSPPEAWRPLAKDFVTSAAAITAFGTSAVDGRPLLMVLSGSGMFALWFAAPLARIAREGAAQRMARKLQVELRRDHLE